jgi:hypothetical protein
MPRHLVIALLGLIASGLLAAADAPPPAARDKGGEPPARPAPEAEVLPQPAPTFTPREKISADSAVAFPVDI